MYLLGEGTFIKGSSFLYVFLGYQQVKHCNHEGEDNIKGGMYYFVVSNE
ncbi:hypothetical protein Amet_0581 [Alkaliphilus metalliredigens QYMF]|uniref:Uncharacterized protein n=1 Tax=Alkaliphilus metalliredigens (strain QYMF) TaxID=293826 RepID=A6TKU0_ALKMQ|nr:hypothetical protein Amet_0581 [Alkaliphilus metalliredigens QYMF]